MLFWAAILNLLTLGFWGVFVFVFAFYILKLVNKSSFEILFIGRSKLQWPAAATPTPTPTAFPVLLAASISCWTTSKYKRIWIKLCLHTEFGI